MDAPKCRICGKRHYGVCHGEVRQVGSEVEAGAMSVDERLDDIENRLDKLETRKKYQRDYMRRQREKG